MDGKRAKGVVQATLVLMTGGLAFLFYYTLYLAIPVSGDHSSAYVFWNGSYKAMLGGELPLWDPFVWGGVSYAGHVFQPFYPILLLLKWVFYNPATGMLGTDIFRVYLALHCAISAIGMYVLLRLVHNDTLVAFIVSLATVLAGGYVRNIWSHLYAPLCWLPLFVACTLLYYRHADATRFIYIALAGVVFAMICLSGSAYGTMFVLWVFALLFLSFCIYYRQDKRKLLRLTGNSMMAGAIGIGLAAIHLFPLMEYMTLTARLIPGHEPVAGASRLSFDAFTESPIPAVMATNLFFGGQSAGWLGSWTLSVFFGILALSKRKSSSPEALFSRLIFILTVMLGLGLILPDFLYYIPGSSSIRQLYLYSPIVSLGLGLLAAEGMQIAKGAKSVTLSYVKWIKEHYATPLYFFLLLMYCIAMLPHRFSWLNLIILLLLMCISVGFLHSFGFFTGKKMEKLLVRLNKYKKIDTVLLAAILLISCAESHEKINNLRKENAVPEFSQSISSSLRRSQLIFKQLDTDFYENIPAAANYQTPQISPYRYTDWGEGNFMDYNIGELLGYRELLGYVNPALETSVKMHINVNLLEKRMVLQNCQYIFLEVNQSEESIDYLEELGFVYLGVLEGAAEDPETEKMHSRSIWRTPALGEGWFVYDAIQYDDETSENELFASLNDPATDLSVTALWNRDSLEELPKLKKWGKGTVWLTGFSYNEIRFSVDTDETGLMVTSDLDFPGWNAYVDGEKVEHCEVNGGNIGVIVPPGAREVILRYQPVSFYFGSILFFVALIAGLCLCIGGFVGTRVRSKPQMGQIP